MKTLVALAVLTVLTVLTVLAASDCERPLSASPACVGAKVPSRRCARPHRDGWCPVCGVGYVAAIAVPSRELFDVLDAHGHDVDPEAMSCATCREAWKTGGYCNPCRMGFVRCQAYLSPLTYHVARAAIDDPARVECEACRLNVADHGWCERCGLGRTGVLILRSREELEETWKAVRKLRRALELLPRCETCAIAAFADGRCRACATSYREGVPWRDNAE